VVEGDRVDGVDLVALGVEVRVEAVHHHHELVGLLAALLGIDDERAVHAARDVLGQRPDVAVVQVHAERLGVELVHRALSRLDQAVADLGHPVHRRRVDAVEVHRVRMLGPVDEADAQQLPLARPQRRARHAAVEGPRRVRDPRGDLDLLVGGDDLPLAQRPPARQPPRPPHVEVPEDLRRVEAVGTVVDRLPLAHRRALRPAAVTLAGVAGRHAGRRGAVGARVEGGERGGCRERAAPQKLPAVQPQVRSCPVEVLPRLNIWVG
jgi:hypothetical protein